MTCAHDPACESRPCIECGDPVHRCTRSQRSWVHQGQCLYRRQRRGPRRSGVGKAAYNREWLAANPDKRVVYARRARFGRHGITEAEYEAVWEAQGRACRICHRTESPKWTIDHDHACCPGEYGCRECFRGILCLLCNTGIAMFSDDPDVMRSAAEYAEARHRPLASSPASR
jgi:hypothetical protein